MRLKVNGITLNVIERGKINHGADRPSLLFLHYFGGSSRAWSEVIDRLADDYHCVAPDLRGFGESDAPEANYAVEDYANDVARLTDALNLNRYVLIGHSMGGKIALFCAAQQLPGLESLVLLAPSPPTPEPMDETERTRLLTGYGERPAAEQTVHNISARPLSAYVFERTVDDNLRSSLPAWRAWLNDGSREDISAAMSSVLVPALIVAGSEDKVLTEDVLAQEVVRRVAGASMTVVTNAGHLLPLEVPGAIVDLIAHAT